VSFWNWRSSGPINSGGSALATPTTDLAPIELYTADTRVVGWIATSGQRVTDLLEEHDLLRLWRPNPGPTDESAPKAGQRVAEPAEGSGDWQSLVTEQVVLVMPPEWRVNRQLRLHRRLRRVAVSVGPFRLTGNVHLAPGTEPEGVLYRRRFLPLTDVHLLHDGEPAFEHVVSVVIVNTAHVTSLVPLISLA